MKALVILEDLPYEIEDLESGNDAILLQLASQIEQVLGDKAEAEMEAARQAIEGAGADADQSATDAAAAADEAVAGATDAAAEATTSASPDRWKSVTSSGRSSIKSATSSTSG